MSTLEAQMTVREAATELVFQEADLLDRQQWQDWVDLYTDDAVYWVPAWVNEERVVENPELELNLIYLKGKGSFEARIIRISSRDSYASLPLPRTTHVIGNVRVDRESADGIELTAKGITLACDPRRGKTIRGGNYAFDLRRTSGGLKIARKKIILLEDAIDGPIDVYHI